MMMQICHRVCIVIFLPTILIIQITIIAARVVKAEDDHHYCCDSYDVAQEVYATEESWTGTTRRSTRRWCHHHPQHHDNNDNPNNNIINNNNNNNATFSSPLLLYFPFEDTYGNVRRPTTRTTTGPTTTTTRIGLPADLFPHHTTTITAGQKQRQQPLLFIQKDDNDAGAKLEKALFCNITPTYTTLTTATITATTTTTTTTSKYTYKKKNNTSSSSSSPTTSIKNHPPSNNHSGHASRNPLSPVRQWQEDNTTTMSMMRMGKSTAVNSHNASRMRIGVSSRNCTNVIRATTTTITITTTTNSTTQTTSKPTVEATVGMTTATTTATTTLPNKTTIQMNPQHNLEGPTIQQQQHVKTPPASSSTADNGNNNTHAKEETEEEEVPTNNNNNKKVDYSSKSVGAILLDSHPKFSGVGHLLQNDKDLYAIVPCAEVPVDVTIGLSEDILVKQVSISNYERYSGSMRTIHIFASTTIVPSSTSTPWKDLGTYQLSKESNGQQPHQQQQPPKTTVLDLRTPVWARYLKIVFLDYYGTEYYCTVSQISVYGSTLLQGFHEQEIAAAAAAAVTDDDDEEAAEEEEEEHQNNDEIQNSNNGDTVEEPSRDTTTTTRMVKQPKDVDATVVVVTTLDSKDDTFQKTHTGNGVPSTANIAFVLEDSRWKDLNDPDKGINSLHCFEELILNALQWENRSMSDEHACLSSSSSSLAMFSAPPVFSKDLPIKAGTTKSHVPLTNHHLVAEEESEHSKPLDRVDTTTTTITSKTTSSTPPMDDAKLQLLLDLLQRFPNAKCLEDLKNFPKLKSKASTGHAPNHDGGLEPIFTKFSSEIKALQADVSSLTKYTKLSNECYQTLLLQVVLDQQKTQRDHAERLENLENSWIIHYSWYTNVKSFVTTNARDLVHGGKRLSTVLGLTSPAWKDSTFCGIIGLLLLVIFVYLGGSRYQGRITIRRQRVRAVPDVLSLNQSSAPPITDQEKQPKSLATSFESDEPSTVVSLDETTSPNHHSKQKKRRKHRFSLIRRDATSTNSV